MWIDSENVCHTVALPDPTTLMSPPFRQCLHDLVAQHPDEVAELLADCEERFFEALPQLPVAVDAMEFVEAPAPAGLLNEQVLSVDELSSLIARTEARWRLDVILALNDYVSE